MNIQLQRDIFSLKPGPLGPTHHVHEIASGRSFPTRVYMSATNVRELNNSATNSEHSEHECNDTRLVVSRANRNNTSVRADECNE